MVAEAAETLGVDPADLDEVEVQVGIETDCGPWVQALTAAGYRVYAVNPLRMARYRERHSVSGEPSPTPRTRPRWQTWSAPTPTSCVLSLVTAPRLRHARRDYFPAALEAAEITGDLTTSYELAELATKPRFGNSPTASSVSSTAASRRAAFTTRQPPGRISSTSSWLDIQTHGMSF